MRRSAPEHRDSFPLGLMCTRIISVGSRQPIPSMPLVRTIHAIRFRVRQPASPVGHMRYASSARVRSVSSARVRSVARQTAADPADSRLAVGSLRGFPSLAPGVRRDHRGLETERVATAVTGRDWNPVCGRRRRCREHVISRRVNRCMPVQTTSSDRLRSPSRSLFSSLGRADHWRVTNVQPGSPLLGRDGLSHHSGQQLEELWQITGILDFHNHGSRFTLDLDSIQQFLSRSQ